MKKLGLKLTILMSSLVVLFTACSNSDSLTYNTSPLSVVTGTISDGPIANAQVFIDLNLNGALDDGEPYDISDAEGRYEINYILDSQRTYMIVVIGDASFNTSDPLDNPDTPLNFIMFGELTSKTQNSSTNIVGETYYKDVNPLLFKNYLGELNRASYGALNRSEGAIKGLINAPEDSSNVNLFQTFILNQVSDVNVTLQEVVEKIEQSNEANRLVDTKSDLSLESSSSFNNSDKNSSTLAEGLYYQDKSTPSKVGDFVFAKSLVPFDTGVSDYDVFVSKYGTILEIPEYETLNDANYTLIDGADIEVRQNGIKVASNAEISSAISSRYGFVSSDKIVDVLQYIEGVWVLKASDISLANIRGVALDLAPFVVVEKSSFVAKTYQVNDFEKFKDTMVVIKGSYQGAALEGSTLLSTQSVALVYAKPSTTGELQVNIPEGFVVEEVVVLSKTLLDITTEQKASVTLLVQDDKVIQNADSITSLNYIKESAQTSLILEGDLMQGSLGIESMIDTNILYNNLVIGLDLVEDSYANGVLLQNINNFMGGSNSFESGSETTITLDEGSLSLNAATQSIQLTYSNATTARELAVEWKFSKNKIVRRVSESYSSGDKKGSKSSSTYTFSYKNAYNGVVAIFDESIANKTTINSYSDTLNASYIGSAIFKRDKKNDALVTLISSKFTQEHESSSSTRGKGYLNGVVTTEDIASTLQDSFDNSLAFDGEFLLQSETYTPIQGSIKVYAEDANSTKGFKNNNTIAQALLLSQAFSKLQSDVFYIGNWSGSFSSNCSDKNGSIYIDFDELSWQGFDGESSYYGTDLKIEDNTSILYNSSSVWGVLKRENELLYGTWRVGSCQGEVTLKQQ